MFQLIRAWLGFNALLALFLILTPGRAEANAHPEVRGGGDHGFGGLDFYEAGE